MDSAPPVSLTITAPTAYIRPYTNTVRGTVHDPSGVPIVTLETWALPARLTETIIDPRDCRPRRDHAERTALLHLADILCRAEGLGNGGDRKIPRLDPEALVVLEMTMEDVREVMDRMNEELVDIPRM